MKGSKVTPNTCRQKQGEQNNKDENTTSCQWCGCSWHSTYE